MKDKMYYRPLCQTGRSKPKGAVPIAGGQSWFSHAEVLQRGRDNFVIPAPDIPAEFLRKLSEPRAQICGLNLDNPRLMGVVNVTPDSFSDGGRFEDQDSALRHAQTLLKDGADILDIGGESTRPKADYVPPELEITRTAPVISALVLGGIKSPISIDTRKSQVADAAVAVGAVLINDVSALSYDDKMLNLLCNSDVPICLMHASGDPKTMQDNPRYSNILLDIYDFLDSRVQYCVDHGISRDRIIVDPGIGFGKTTDHNLGIMRGLSIFHGLGCAILLGVSRKRFIGEIGKEQQADLRAPGSIALGLEGVRQGVQILRVHDIRETKQALRLWQASR